GFAEASSNRMIGAWLAASLLASLALALGLAALANRGEGRKVSGLALALAALPLFAVGALMLGALGSVAAALVLAAFAAAGARAQLGATAVALAIGLVAVFADGAVMHASNTRLAKVAGSSWAESAGYQPSTFFGSSDPEEPVAFALPGGLQPAGKSPIAWSD